MIELLLAFLAGILTIAAPCILLPLPILLGSSVGQQNKMRPLFITGGFVLTFTALGITLNFLVQNLGIDPNTLRISAVILLAIFALFMIWPTPFEKLTAHLSGLASSAAKTGRAAGSGNWGGFVMGVVIGIIWAPCAGPILGSILTLIAREENTSKAFALLLAYALGAGLPMLGIAYGGQAITTKIKSIAKYTNTLQRIFGIILLLLAAAIYLQYDTKIQSFLVSRLPVINSKLEQNIINKISPAQLPTRTPLPDQNFALPDLGAAPEITGISSWLNSEPLTLQALRGKVVLIDFWTYSCINCIRTLPYVTKWYEDYKDKGLVIIGIHTPEFAFEKEESNVTRALGQHGINYPVALDNDYATWTAFHNRYWPAHYLIDQRGRLRYVHFGEGNYAGTKAAIASLLKINEVSGAAENSPSARAGTTPEIYFGAARQQYLASSYSGQVGTNNFIVPNRLDLHNFALEGKWQIRPDSAELQTGPGKIKLHFLAQKVFMVASSKIEQSITVKVGNNPASIINIGPAELYTVFESGNYAEHELEISIPRAGLEAFTFTFG